MVFPKLYIHSLQKCPSCVKHVVPLEPDILGDFGEEGVVLLKVLLLAPLSWNLPAAHKNSQGSSPISGNLFLKDSSTTISSTMANPGNPTADATLWLCISRLLAVNTKAAPPPSAPHFPTQQSLRILQRVPFHSRLSYTFAQIFDNNFWLESKGLLASVTSAVRFFGSLFATRGGSVAITFKDRRLQDLPFLRIDANVQKQVSSLVRALFGHTKMAQHPVIGLQQYCQSTSTSPSMA